MIRPADRVIHLDTCFLVRAHVSGSRESSKLHGWLKERSRVAISAFTWGEFLCGPVREEDEAQARRIAPKHLPVRTAEATEAARLFNEAGRRRGSFPDCIIAATAILAEAELATSNPVDFGRFVDAGLVLAE